MKMPLKNIISNISIYMKKLNIRIIVKVVKFYEKDIIIIILEFFFKDSKQPFFHK